MDTGDSPRPARPTRPPGRLLAALCLLAFAWAAGAVDNPDAPDYIGEFRQRSAVLEEAVSEAAGGSAASELGAWIEFLQSELSQAEAELTDVLSAPERQRLQRAQAAWRKQADVDQALMRAVWTRERAGSSAALAVGLERGHALQQRVEFLLRMRGAVFAESH